MGNAEGLSVSTPFTLFFHIVYYFTCNPIEGPTGMNEDIFLVGGEHSRD